MKLLNGKITNYVLKNKSATKILCEIKKKS